MDEKKIIVLAADQRFFCRPLIERLENLGFSVEYCGSSGEVISVFKSEKKEQICLFITDMMLAHGTELSDVACGVCVETGKVLAEWVRRSDFSIPILIYSHTGKGNISVPNYPDIYFLVLPELGGFIDPIFKVINPLLCKIKT